MIVIGYAASKVFVGNRGVRYHMLASSLSVVLHVYDSCLAEVVIQVSKHVVNVILVS